jgi:hypothetical protein
MGQIARRGNGARRIAVAGTVALLTLASLSLLAWTKLAGPPPVAPGTTVTMAGITLDVQESEWAVINHVENGQGGYLMPDQMMPGAPTGNEMRLGVHVTLTNAQSRTMPFSLVDEFTMSGGLEPEPHPLSADTVGALNRLGPGAAMQGVLYFDVEVPDMENPTLPQLYLQWSRSGDAVRIPVQLPGEMPEHDH